MQLRAVFAALVVLAALPALAEPRPEFTIATTTEHPLAGKVWLPSTANFVPADTLARLAATADAVMLGETHDNPDHHALQAWMVRQLASGPRKPLVAFEMLDSAQREKLEAHLTANPGDTAGIGAAVEWDKTGWPQWEVYRPIAEAALSAGGRLVPANLSRADTRALGKGEAPDLAVRLGLDRPLDPMAEAALAEEIKESHCGMLPDKAVPAMVRIQRARDRAMASVLADALADGSLAILIAGSGHARTDRAVPSQLVELRPGTRTFSVGFVEVRPEITEPSAYAENYGAAALPFDAVMFTPRADREDQCEELRKHMEKKAEKDKK